ncbi:aminoglycoside adenylyltransferase domain-containing protein [Neisseriaceae bacterium CLB008]
MVTRRHSGPHLCPPQPDPGLAILLAQAGQASHRLIGPDAKTLFNPIPKEDLLSTFQHTLNQWRSPDDLSGDERNIILAIGRIWYSVHTHKITTKGQTAASQLPAQHAQLLATACAEYLGHTTHDWHSALSQVIDFVAHAQTRLNLLITTGLKE